MFLFVGMSKGGYILRVGQKFWSAFFASAMDQQASARWLETLKAEAMTKSKWESKYLTKEQQQRELQEVQEAVAELAASTASSRKGHISERDAMALRLRALDDEPEDFAAKPRVAPDYEVMRARVAAEVAATRQRSHRFTGELTTEAMLRDIGPGLWTSINPMYTPLKLKSTTHTTHAFFKSKGWGEKVDKTVHLKQDDMSKHADKCLKLGENPFKSGGMKSS